MNIRRSTPPGMRVRKFYSGGKGPESPRLSGFPQETIKGTEIDTNILDSILMNKHGKGEYDFSEFRDLVGNHEGGIGGYSAIQKGGGPGRGKYQFDAASAATAYQRLKNIAEEYNLFVPVLTEDQLKNMDKVSPELQDLLFTANIAKSPDTSVATILTDKTQWDNQWAVGHWRGNKEDLATRLASFKHTKENMPSANNDNSTENPENINSLFFGSFPTEQNAPGSTLTLPQKIYND